MNARKIHLYMFVKNGLLNSLYHYCNVRNQDTRFHKDDYNAKKHQKTSDCL